MPHRSYVTIVSGLPRSGTSLMMQMLEAGGIPSLTDGVRAADEDNPRGYYEFEPVKQTRKDSTWVAQGIGRVVKMVHLLLLDLPPSYRYRVVFMRRDLEEVVRSQDIMLERHGKPSDEQTKERLKKVFAGQIGTVQERLAGQPDRFQLIEVDYNCLVADPAREVGRLSEFLDGLDTDRMIQAVDPTLYRNRIQNRR